MNKLGIIVFSLVGLLGITWAIFGENPTVKIISIVVIAGAISFWIALLAISWIKNKIKK